MKEYIKTIALSVFLLIVVAAGVGVFAWSYKFDKYCYELAGVAFDDGGNTGLGPYQ